LKTEIPRKDPLEYFRDQFNDSPVPFRLFRVRITKRQATENPKRIIKQSRKLCMNTGKRAVVMGVSPRKTPKTIPAIATLMVIPKRRMVSIIPEARLYIPFGTALIVVRTSGD
jgi:hypothetical protein